jgi:Tol biopolymer transport system component
MENRFKIKNILLAYCLILISLLSCNRKNEPKHFSHFPILTGEYLGQESPGLSAKLFAPGIISTEHNEFTPTFSKDGNELYFTLGGPSFYIIHLKKENSTWLKPQIAPFSGEYDDADPVFSPDGSRIYFASKRPFSKEDKQRNDFDFWFIQRTETGWSEPQYEGLTVNSERDDLVSSISENGTKYFDYKGDIYKSQFLNGQYTKPEKLGDSINSKYWELKPFIAADESYLIFVSCNPDIGDGIADLCISFKNEDGSWTNAKNMGEQVNSAAVDQAPVVTPDGKYLFFSSRRLNASFLQKPDTYDEIRNMLNRPGNGSSDIYWVDAKIINLLKTK